MPILQTAERRPFAVLLVLCLALYVPGWFTLPALDRDEARFAQATKQMMEAGKLMVPRFQDELRAKKPVGIYWAQAAAVGAVGGPEGTGIWAYRIPSVIAAILAAWLTFLTGRVLYGQRAGVIAGAMMACAIALVAEANIAKTDAALCAATIAAQLALARCYRARDASRPDPGWGNAVLFWGAVSVGVLLKGPIMPMVVALTAVALVIIERRAKWLLLTRPLAGVALFLLLTLPWAIAAWDQTDGAFFGQAVGGDLAPKLMGAQESHGAPTGYYLALVLATFFPGSLLLIPALARGWHERLRDGARFAGAWLVPSWIVFEIVPTKLPHYVLPLYPALAILVGAFAVEAIRNPELIRRPLARGGFALWGIVTLLLAAVLVAAPVSLPDGLAIEPGPWPVIGAGLFAAVALRGLAWAWRGRVAAAIVTVAVAAVVFSVSLLEITRARLDSLWVAEKVAALTHETGTEGRPLAAAGFSEPSLVFLMGTETQLVRGEEAAEWLARAPGGIALVEDREMAHFDARAAELGLTPHPLGVVSGLNYSRGKAVKLTLFEGETPPAGD